MFNDNKLFFLFTLIFTNLTGVSFTQAAAQYADLVSIPDYSITAKTADYRQANEQCMLSFYSDDLSTAQLYNAEYQDCACATATPFNNTFTNEATEQDETLDNKMFSRLAAIYSVFCLYPDQIWDFSFRFDQMPLLLVYRNRDDVQQYAYLLNHPEAASLPSSERVETDSILNLPPIYKLTKLPDAEELVKVPFFDFQYEIAGTASYVMIYTDIDNDSFSAPVTPEWGAYLTHEGLHNHQFAFWKENPDDIQDEENYPLKADNIADIHLETKILLDALKTENFHSLLKSLEWFVAVRSERMQGNTIIKHMDGALERYEGIALYVEYNLHKFIPNPQLLSIAETVQTTLSTQVQRSDLTFDRFYASGAALSILLDRFYTDWKPLIEEGFNQYEILSDLLRLTDNADAKATLLEEARHIYDYESLIKLGAVIASQIDSESESPTFSERATEN